MKQAHEWLDTAANKLATKTTEQSQMVRIITAARLRAQSPLRRSRRKGDGFFEVIFVTVSWLLVAEPLARFAPRSQCNLKK